MTTTTGKVKKNLATCQAPPRRAGERVWNVEIEFLVFESEAKREQAYRAWADLLVRARSRLAALLNGEKPRESLRSICSTVAANDREDRRYTI